MADLSLALVVASSLQPTIEVVRRRCVITAPRCLAARIRASAISQATDEESGFSCTFCKAKGWLVCDFCEGQKVNVKVKSNRMYRRCPSCKAVGVVLCPKCKVFKCVTFPDGKDGGFEM